LEVYCPGQKIVIPFVYEHIRFLSHQTLRGRYTILVRNESDRPIEHLCWLYPRALLSGPNAAGEMYLKKTYSIELEDLGLPFVTEFDGTELTAHVPNPTEPENNMTGIVGKFDTENYFFGLPHSFNARQIALLDTYGLTAVYVKLRQPIAPKDSHWFAWEITTERHGTLIEESVIGPHVYHYFASPVYVHRTVRETYLSGISDFDLFDDFQAEHYPAHVTTVEQFGLKAERDVDIKYHQLLIVPGDPKKCALSYWDSQGDVRMMSGSPHIIQDGNGAIPVFDWKSGSILQPEHPWKDLGFMLRIVLHFALHSPPAATAPKLPPPSKGG